MTRPASNEGDFKFIHDAVTFTILKILYDEKTEVHVSKYHFDTHTHTQKKKKKLTKDRPKISSRPSHSNSTKRITRSYGVMVFRAIVPTFFNGMLDKL